MEACGAWLGSSGSEIVLEMRSLPKVVGRTARLKMFGADRYFKTSHCLSQFNGEEETFQSKLYS